MAKRGRVVTFHGAFGMKTVAKRKERALRRRGLHPYVQEFKVKGHKRFGVLTRRKS